MLGANNDVNVFWGVLGFGFFFNLADLQTFAVIRVTLKSGRSGEIVAGVLPYIISLCAV